MTPIDVLDAVMELVRKAKETQKADDALKFSQAACNIANARSTMMVMPPAPPKELPDVMFPGE